jgi:hypothetical protein
LPCQPHKLDKVSRMELRVGSIIAGCIC